MGTKIILLSDGTGNSAAKIWRTNVWRFFEALDVSRSDHRVFYDDGIGSATFKPVAIIAGAFGFGLTRNVIDLYKFVCRNYQPGDEIYGLGFSRGAFTIRIVMDLIIYQGLVPVVSEADLDWKAKAAYRAYRDGKFCSVLRIANVCNWLQGLCVRKVYDASSNVKIEQIRFVGLWDTVAAYGFPVEGMTRGVSKWLWPLDLADHTLAPAVKRACHALSLDDARAAFYPILWTEEGETPATPNHEGLRYTNRERMSQVWFPGVHANVGGGYPEDSLARISLLWMIEEAAKCGLQFKRKPDAEPDSVVATKSGRDKDGRLYNPRRGFGASYRYAPRKLVDLCDARFGHLQRSTTPDSVKIKVPKIHESVFQRLDAQAHPYAPVGLPAKYEIVATDGQITGLPDKTSGTKASDTMGPFRIESSEEATARSRAQDHVWNLIWVKQQIYAISAVVIGYLFVYPLLPTFSPLADHGRTLRIISDLLRPISDLIRIADNILWGVFHRPLNHYAQDPLLFSIVAGSALLLMWLNLKLNVKIMDEMLAIWKGHPSHKTSARHSVVYRLRNNGPYKAVLRIVREDIFPTFFALCLGLMLAYGILIVVDRVAFGFADAAGAFCRGTPSEFLKPLALGEPEHFQFSTSEVCFPTKVLLNKGDYLIHVTAYDWSDEGVKADLTGLQINNLPWWKRAQLTLASPFRRRLMTTSGGTKPLWFSLIMRIGSGGSIQYSFDPHPGASNEDQDIRAVTDTGELFMYIDDIILPIPSISGLFYAPDRHKGTVYVDITKAK